MKPFDLLGLIVSIGLFLGSVIIMIIGWANENEDYVYMLFPLFISIWGIWGAGSLLMKKRKGKGASKR